MCGGGGGRKGGGGGGRCGEYSAVKMTAAGTKRHLYMQIFILSPNPKIKSKRGALEKVFVKTSKNPVCWFFPLTT